MTQFNQPLGGNDMPRFAGPATMMRLPTQTTAKGLDVCFVGVPIDIGSSNRSGTRHGPPAWGVITSWKVVVVVSGSVLNFSSAPAPSCGAPTRLPPSSSA